MIVAWLFFAILLAMAFSVGVFCPSADSDINVWAIVPLSLATFLMIFMQRTEDFRKAGLLFSFVAFGCGIKIAKTISSRNRPDDSTDSPERPEHPER